MNSHLESTASCSAVPVVLFALEELGLSYSYALREDGYFLRTYNKPGPTLQQGDVLAVSLPEVLLALSRRTPARTTEQTLLGEWVGVVREAGPALGKLRAGVTGDERTQALQTLQRVVTALDERLGARSFLGGEEVSLADCLFVALPLEGPVSVVLPSGVKAYVQRLRARSSFQRATARRAIVLAGNEKEKTQAV